MFIADDKAKILEILEQFLEIKKLDKEWSLPGKWR